MIEIDGPADEVAVDRRGACDLRAARRHEIRSADAAERALWKGRKSAFAAVGRISPAFIVQDGVVPRTALGEVLARIAELTGETGVRVANVFHAGDGNLHPLVLFDDAKPGAEEAAEEMSGAIIDLCVDHGGSITGEHGVGVDKIDSISKMFGPDDLDTMQMMRCAFDPDRLSNPGKIFPTPRLCGEVPGSGASRIRWLRPGRWINFDSRNGTPRGRSDSRGARGRVRGRQRGRAGRRGRRGGAAVRGPSRRCDRGGRSADGRLVAGHDGRAARLRNQARLGGSAHRL